MGLIGLTHAAPVHEEERPLAAAPPGPNWSRLAKMAAAVLVPCAVAYGLHRGSEPEGLDAADLPRASGVASSGAGATLARSLKPDGGPPSHGFQDGAFGHSNAVRVRVVLPDEVIALPMTFADNTAGLQSQWIAFDGKPNEPVVPWRGDGGIRTPSRPGAFWLVLSRAGVADTIADLALFVEVPMPNKMATGINGYHMGRWPKAAANIVPRGFIEVTQRTADFPLTPHLKMSDFVVHDEQDGFPKYLHVREKLLDKIELVLAEIAKMRGRTVSALTLNVASGFRSPAHNGGLSGSAQDSRHMYGDAADIAIDVNNDRVLNEIDARLVAAAAEAVERAHPDLVGGIGLYITPDGAGWPYVHIDTRGTRARWRGGARKGTVDSLPADATFDSTGAASSAAAPAAVAPAATPAPTPAAPAPRAKPDSGATTSSTFAGVTAPTAAPSSRAAVKVVSAPAATAAPAPVAAPRAAPVAAKRTPVRPSRSAAPTRVVAVSGSRDEPTVVALAGPRTPSRRPAAKAAPRVSASSRAAAARKAASRKAAPKKQATPAAPALRRKGVVASAGTASGSASARNRSRPRTAQPAPADDPFASAARRFRATRP